MPDTALALTALIVAGGIAITIAVWAVRAVLRFLREAPTDRLWHWAIGLMVVSVTCQIVALVCNVIASLQ